MAVSDHVLIQHVLLIGCKVGMVGKKDAFSGSESFSTEVLRMSRIALALTFGEVETLTFRDGCWDCYAGFLIGLEAVMSLIRTEACNPTRCRLQSVPALVRID